MHEIVLKKANVTATADLLSMEDLSAVVALHNKTIAALPEESKRFVLPQNEDYFADLLSGFSGAVVGIKAKGELVAQIAVAGELSIDEAVEKKLITKNNVSFHHVLSEDSIVVFKSLVCDPDWSGNDLGFHTVAAALKTPLVESADNILTQISAANIRSTNMFLSRGFGIVAAGYDPIDNLPRFVFQKPLNGFSFVPNIIADAVDPITDFPAIMKLTERDALVGISEDSSYTSLSFLEVKRIRKQVLQDIRIA
ncbi:MAG: hypothetical protein FWF23_05045 [Alphaproteobacteria bacterium]|nr:hypothetical protein [Alphaproteobacteria bacterium]MCL2504633.1 hypothetical protein [Alphaproteobacteria bacterium]